MSASRPVYLNLFTFKFPATAIASILHRLSGVFLFMLIPYFLVLLDTVNTDSSSVMQQQVANSVWFTKILWWLGLSALVYHTLAGIRHLIMDFGVGESLLVSRITAYLVMIVSFILSILIGLRL